MMTASGRPQVLTDAMTHHGPAAAGEGTALPGLLIACAFTLFVTNLDFFLFIRGYVPVNTLIVFVAFSTVFLALVPLSGDRQGLNRFVLGLRLNRVPFALFALWIVTHVVTSGATVLVGGDVDYAQIFPIFQFMVIAFGLLLAATDPGGRQIAAAARWAIVVLGASVIFETIVPGALGSATARTGGFALNANIPGFILPALLAVCLDFRRVRPLDLIVLLVALVSVTCTLSRMGLGLLLLVIGVYFYFHLLRGAAEARLRKLALLTIFAIGLAALAVGSLSYLASIASFDDEFQARVAILLAGDAVFEDPYRRPLFDHFALLASQHPWLGYAAGETLMNATVRAPLQFGPHNMYLRAWIDTGMPGLVVYSAFVVSIIGLGILRRSVATTLIGILVALYGLFSHNVTDNKAVLILIGAALGLSAMREREV